MHGVLTRKINNFLSCNRSLVGFGGVDSFGLGHLLKWGIFFKTRKTWYLVTKIMFSETKLLNSPNVFMWDSEPGRDRKG